MKFVRAAFGNSGQPVKTTNGPRYQVRWYFDAGIREKEKKRTTFRTKGEGHLFMEQLRKAGYEVEGWYFTPAGDPTNVTRSSTTVLDAVLRYFATKWDANWDDNQRRKAVGRFGVVVAMTLEQRRDREGLYNAFMAQAGGRGQRPDPSSQVEWAGRWLRDVALYPSQPHPTDANLLRGRDWLMARSMPVDRLRGEAVVELRTRMTAGLAASSQRTYWESTVVTFLRWLVDADVVKTSPLVGIPKRSVNVGPKRADPRRIPNPAQVQELADQMREEHGGNWDLFVLLGSYCALRSGELFALRTSSFFRRDDGRLMLDVSAQEHRVVAATSDTGATKSRTTPKSVKGHEPRSRRVPVPKELASTLALRFPNLGQGSQYLFVGPRGATANYDTVRTWWHEAVAAQFPDGHRLAGITPHAMRHAGMSWWFAANFDEAVIQQWGGWSSLKVMLDVYRGVLEDINNMNLAGLDQFEGSWRAVPELQAPDARTDSGTITILSEWKRRGA